MVASKHVYKSLSKSTTCGAVQWAAIDVNPARIKELRYRWFCVINIHFIGDDFNLFIDLSLAYNIAEIYGDIGEFFRIHNQTEF